MTTSENPGLVFRERIDRIRQVAPSGVMKEMERHRYTIKDVGVGGVINVGLVTYLVTGKSSYIETNDDFSKEKGDPWHELTLVRLDSGETCYIEWEEDDELVIYFTQKRLKFRDLRDDEGVGIDEDDLDQIVNDGDSVFYEGVEYAYDDDYAARYTRGGQGRDTKGDKVYFYEFCAENGDAVTVEEWKDGKDYSYELFASYKVARIAVIALGDKG